MQDTEKRIETAAKHLARALRKINEAGDFEMSRRLSQLLANEMQAVREGR